MTKEQLKVYKERFKVLFVQENSFKQEFENMSHNYQLNEDGITLVHTDSDPLQELMNSRRQETLTDMFNKYMDGMISPNEKEQLERTLQTNALYDARVRNLDKVQAAEMQQAVQLTIRDLENQNKINQAALKVVKDKKIKEDAKNAALLELAKAGEQKNV